MNDNWTKLALEKQKELLEGAKTKEDFDKVFETMRDLVAKYNPDKKERDCKNCQALGEVYKKAWEMTKWNHHTFKYQCNSCGFNWIHTFYKVED